MNNAGDRIIRMFAMLGDWKMTGSTTSQGFSVRRRSAQGRMGPSIIHGLARGWKMNSMQFITDLDPAIHGDELISTLRAASELVHPGRWPSLEDVPPVFVCRACGRSQLRAEPEVCDNCGARPVTLQPIPTVFYTLPITVDDVLATLEASGAEVVTCLTGIDEETADGGEWPARMILEHLLGSGAVFMGRIERVVTEDEPLLGSINPDDITDDNAGAPTMATMLAAFSDRREHTRTIASLVAR